MKVEGDEGVHASRHFVNTISIEDTGIDYKGRPLTDKALNSMGTEARNNVLRAVAHTGVNVQVISDGSDPDELEIG